MCLGAAWDKLNRGNDSVCNSTVLWLLSSEDAGYHTCFLLLWFNEQREKEDTVTKNNERSTASFKKGPYFTPFWDLIWGIGTPKMTYQWFKLERTSTMCISMSSLLPLSGPPNRTGCFHLHLEPLLWLADCTLSDMRPGLSPVSFWVRRLDWYPAERIVKVQKMYSTQYGPFKWTTHCASPQACDQESKFLTDGWWISLRGPQN